MVSMVMPTTSLRICSTYVLSRITYGLESLNLTPADFRILEAAHNTLLRQIQSLPSRVAIMSLYILLGTPPIEPHNDRNRLPLLHSMRLNNTLSDLILRQLAVQKYNIQQLDHPDPASPLQIQPTFATGPHLTTSLQRPLKGAGDKMYSGALEESSRESGIWEKLPEIPQ